MVNSYLQIFLLSIISLSLIHAFYYLFKLKWPEIYFAVADRAELYFSYSAGRYIAFRLTPIFLIITFILSISRTLAIEERIYAALIIGLSHVLLTNAISFGKVVKSDKTVHIYLNRLFQLIFHALSIISIVLISAIAGFASSWDKIQLLTPTWNGLIDNLWSSFFTAFIAIFFYKLYQRGEMRTDDLFEKYLKKIDCEVIEAIESESKKNKANENLVKAICIVENIQRPSWVRKIEKIKSFVSAERTYGIMQLKSVHFLSDMESVKLAIEKFFKNTELKKWEEMTDIVRSYNNDIRYIEFVEAAYRHITGEINFDPNARG